MRSSSADRALPLADRAGWVRLAAAVLLGLVAAAGPIVGRTSAQFTDTDEVTVATVGTPDQFAPTPTPTPTQGQPADGSAAPGSELAPDGADGPDGSSVAPAGRPGWPDRDGPWSSQHRPRLPWVR
jgi:hypothetical protein